VKYPLEVLLILRLRPSCDSCLSMSHSFEDRVKRILTSGCSSLDTYDLNVLLDTASNQKTITESCKHSDANITVMTDTILSHIRSHNPQIEYACVILSDHVFRKSSVFRKCLLEELQVYVEATTETTTIRFLFPKEWASKLRVLGRTTLYEWHSKYGSTHREVSALCRFMVGHCIDIHIHIPTREQQRSVITTIPKWQQETADKKREGRLNDILAEIGLSKQSIIELVSEMVYCIIIKSPHRLFTNTFSIILLISTHHWLTTLYFFWLNFYHIKSQTDLLMTAWLKSEQESDYKLTMALYNRSISTNPIHNLYSKHLP